MTATDQGTEQSAPCKLPAGFRFAGVTCGIKPSGKADLSLIVADHPVTAAGVYTQNQVVAAPVVLCRERTPRRTIRAVVTNSGNANACTGATGMRDAKAMCQQVAKRINCDPDDVLVMSTGIIGKTLPMNRIEAGIDSACDQLARDRSAFFAAAEAIRTTDVDRKTVCREVQCGSRVFRIAAMAKGAGMIAPNMATMLAVILTDAPLSPENAQNVLSQATQVSFNRVSVDGHTSTNDTLLLLSSGFEDELSASELESFQAEVNRASIELAKQLVADGEGASHVMAIRVVGAADESSAEIIAETVAASPLVKTAITGGDPNWGRIVSAAGYAKAEITPERTSLEICGTAIYQNGSPVEYDEASLSRTMKASPEVEIVLRVGDGPGEVEYWASDLTTEYVQFNSEYTT